MLNILVVCHYGLYQNLTFSFVHNQIREYAALGHRVRVIIPNGVGKNGREGGRFGRPLLTSNVDGVELFDLRYVTLSAYGEKKFNSASAIGAIRLQWKRIFQDFKPDVIHAHTLGFDSDIGVWLKEKLGCPLVVTTHGGDTERHLAKGETDYLKTCCDGADAVAAVSSRLQARLGTCGTETPLYTIHNGFVPRKADASLVRQPMSMIQVGHLIPSKRTDVTIRAFAKLREKHPEMRLTIVGQGAEREKLEQLCRELRVTESVEFAGQIPNQNVFEKMCQSEFFVMASKPEGFGIVYLEAMAAGCVTIGTEGEGISDLIVSGENGFLVPADDPDAIVRVVDACIQDPERADRIAAKGCADASGLTWRKNAEQYINLFKEVLYGR